MKFGVRLVGLGGGGVEGVEFRGLVVGSRGL